ncbi:aspartate ammonia-lyase [Massilia sp. WF1]|uniref:aspartate ammonia-lyase n=1 Tax=unclassified Massilia TaxID=2609279 RepID=UPI00064A1534|nr:MULTISPECIES: aspartate ammonia-lyase [unclassified Massilia]ALK96782.1 class II fumarate hydratase [Massilia sp. WG5]KLU38125.1 aspartate ammonia-lyase [Massilia sp. WF1]
MHASTCRIEHDLLGQMALPHQALYGIHSQRARENFAISGVSVGQFPDLVRALADVKQAAAEANHALGILAADKARAIAAACAALRDGAHHDQFVVDMLQGGAGTSTNMNANEVIANLALEHMGRERGDYAWLHPNEDVNLSQSTNDVYPTALRLALHAAGQRLLAALALLRAAFQERADAFADVLKMGRTQLQDAVPMTLGQEFGAFAGMMAAGASTLAASLDGLLEINLGGTAIGTGLNAPPGYAACVRERLAHLSGLALVTAPDLVGATQDTDALVALSAACKRIAIKLSKTCNDLRLLASGPRAGFGDIELPALQAGSSIMPGKVNPVIPEVVNQIAFEVIGNDLTVCMAAEAGQLQLNAFEPVIGFALLRSLQRLEAGCRTLAVRCVAGIRANETALQRRVRESIGLVTALSPIIGYERAGSLARAARDSGRGVAELVLERGWMDAAELEAALRPERLAGLAG